jgi:TolB-like protein/Flp pilus assembly protein TadD
MGEVYRARDTRLGREVAIKVLPPAFLRDPERLRRFEQEARAASALNQPNVLTIHDVGQAEQGPYVVSELLDGETLRAILADGKLPARRALDYAVQVARGLAAAHEKGIVHRDLKPENLFVTRDGRVKILDFGLAKLTEPEKPADSATEAPTAAPATEAGVVLGTIHYMSPEQARGKPADARSDIFSFGLVLYEMLSGNKAFARDSAAETMSAILKEDPPELSTQSHVPPGLDRIVRHCLEKDPERRFRSAHDLAFDLESLSDLSKPSAPAKRLTAGRRSVFLSALVAAFVAVVGLFFWRARGNRPAGPDLSALAHKSIAVLPFQNLSPDPENAFFADGMTEDILTQLAKIRDLKVISHTSVMRYKGTQKPIQTIASELGVATVLEGSVRRAGDRVRIVSQLVDARTDEHLWAETYDRDLKDVFAIQSEVARQIASALRATLSPEERKRIEQRPTGNLAAYDLYLKGRELYNHYRKADNESAIELFQKALELDSGFALGYAGLGDSYAQRVLRFGFPQAAVEPSLQMSRKAIALDPELAEGYKALGLALQVKGAHREALEALRRAAEINPGVGIYNLGAVLRQMGRLDEALSWMLRARDLDPNNSVTPAGISSCYAALRDFGQAERWLKRSLEIQPDLSQAHHFLALLLLQERRDEDALRQARDAMTLLPGNHLVTYDAAIAELIAGNPLRAEPLFERSLPAFRGKRISPPAAGAGVETYLASLHLRAGRRGQADALLEESLATNRRAAEEGNQDWSVPFDTACVHALRGEKDEAFRWLDKAVEAGWRGWPLGTRSPLLDSLRGDPRFRQLEARLDDLVRQLRRRAGLS